MQTLRLALIAIGLWLAAGGLALALLPVLGSSGGWYALCGGLFAISALATLYAAYRFERQQDAALQAVALAAGLTEHTDDRLTLTAIVARLERRLEKAHHFKRGIVAMHQCVLLVNDTGTIVAASAGLSALAPDAVEGNTLDALLGHGYLAAGGGVPETALAVLGTKRFEVVRRSLVAGLYLLELVPAGSYIEDDDLDAFAAALQSGQTSFRFETDIAANHRVLAALNQGIEAVDFGLRQLDSVMAGDEDGSGGFGALGRQAQELAQFVAAVETKLIEEADLRQSLEFKLKSVAGLIEGFERRMSSMGGLAAESQDEAQQMSRALTAGTDRLKQARVLGRQAENLAGAADVAAQRTHAVVGAIDAMTLDIDKMVAAIESVSFRTNLLALNAAVEAARAGEKGAGFAVVADEVRMLAQLTSRSAKDIRAVVSHGRTQAETGLSEAATLQRMIGDLSAHLRNLSNETDTIASTLSEGEAALTRLVGRMDRFGDAAGPETVPLRRASA